MPVHHQNHTAALLVGAGESRRMGFADAPGALTRKPFVMLGGLMVVELACLAFDRSKVVRDIVLVAHADDLPRLEQLAKSSPALRKVTAITAGGELRVDSVRAGMDALRTDIDLVAIHDVARPLVSTELIEQAISVASQHNAAVTALAATDTLKISSDGRHAESTLDRSVVWRAQTPQVFRASLFRELLQRAMRDGFRPTDDSALYEKYLGPVPIVPGDPTNVKITTQGDLALCEAILRLHESKRARRT